MALRDNNPVTAAVPGISKTVKWVLSPSSVRIAEYSFVSKLSTAVEMETLGRVCVTDAGGYLGSWVVKLLLSRGSEKNAHLKKLDHAPENLQLFKADLPDYVSLCAAIAGCDGVFHIASPYPPGSVPNPEIDLIEPAVTGTLNVLKASTEAKVRQVIVVSSAFAVAMTPNWPKDKIIDETCWSDKVYCRTTGVIFSYASRWFKILFTINRQIWTLFGGAYETMENKIWRIVDVRDVAEALLLIYEGSDASGRYICGPHAIQAHDLVEKLQSMFPLYNYPQKFVNGSDDICLSSERLKSLGWKHRPSEETLVDSVQYYEQASLLKKD